MLSCLRASLFLRSVNRAVLFEIFLTLKNSQLNLSEFDSFDHRLIVFAFSLLNKVMFILSFPYSCIRCKFVRRTTVRSTPSQISAVPQVTGTVLPVDPRGPAAAHRQQERSAFPTRQNFDHRFKSQSSK